VPWRVTIGKSITRAKVNGAAALLRLFGNQRAAMKLQIGASHACCGKLALALVARCPTHALAVWT
jgi:hypothetical protein